MSAPLLTLKNLSKTYRVGTGFLGSQRRSLKAVDRVDLNVDQGEVLGLVGEKRLRQIHPGTLRPAPYRAHLGANLF